ncbi:MAG: hypothetical protein ACO377_11945, partial [Pseudomonadales bacterium]
MRKQVSRLLLGGSTALLLALPWAPTAVAAEAVCYQNDEGRIVQRRRPGFKPVPCPAPAEGSDTASEAAAPVSNAATRRRIRQSEWQRISPAMADRKPNPASVVPRPGLPDYVDRVPLPA